MTEHPEAEPAADPSESDVRQATVRRAPKWSAFIVVGMLLGLVVTIAVTTAFPADPEVGMTMTVLVVGIFGVSGGAALGALGAIIADRVSRGRAREVTVERGEVVAEAPEPATAPNPAPRLTPGPSSESAPSSEPTPESAPSREPTPEPALNPEASGPSDPA